MVEKETSNKVNSGQVREMDRPRSGLQSGMIENGVWDSNVPAALVDMITDVIQSVSARIIKTSLLAVQDQFTDISSQTDISIAIRKINPVLGDPLSTSIALGFNIAHEECDSTVEMTQIVEEEISNKVNLGRVHKIYRPRSSHRLSGLQWGMIQNAVWDSDVPATLTDMITDVMKSLSASIIQASLVAVQDRLTDASSQTSFSIAVRKISPVLGDSLSTSIAAANVAHKECEQSVVLTRMVEKEISNKVNSGRVCDMYRPRSSHSENSEKTDFQSNRSETKSFTMSVPSVRTPTPINSEDILPAMSRCFDRLSGLQWGLIENGIWDSDVQVALADMITDVIQSVSVRIIKTSLLAGQDRLTEEISKTSLSIAMTKISPVLGDSLSISFAAALDVTHEECESAVELTQMVEEEISNKVNSGWVLVPENPDSVYVTRKITNIKKTQMHGFSCFLISEEI
ncbi:uncharacterized protein LOC120722329 [Simochromis diagramma]|uniref:uncharacterized protein LOC120722329 n=1 Tax=Simochromis diagramma TaxID=43689 RepID=UPI001A7E45C8|nr:uncharacterized protein LOC120722329 [Simochromis diagramma]